MKIRRYWSKHALHGVDRSYTYVCYVDILHAYPMYYHTYVLESHVEESLLCALVHSLTNREGDVCAAWNARWSSVFIGFCWISKKEEREKSPYFAWTIPEWTIQERPSRKDIQYILSMEERGRRQPKEMMNHFVRSKMSTLFISRRQRIIPFMYCFFFLLCTTHLIQETSGQEQEQLYLEPEEFFLGIQNGEYDAIFDVRTEDEWLEGHIENATHIENLATTGAPSSEIIMGCSKKGCTIAVYCAVGVRAATAITRLQTIFGFTGTIYNARGVNQWTEAGYPLVTTEESTIPPCANNKCDSCKADCTTVNTDSGPISSLFPTTVMAIVITVLFTQL